MSTPPPSSNAAATTGPTAAASSALDVVYILGAHRSGSTFLGALLGAVPGVFFEGEAYRFPRPIFWPGDPGRLCSCGEPLDRCTFWSVVKAELEQRSPLLEEVDRGQRRYESWGALSNRLAALVRPDPELTTYVRRMVEFLRTVAAHGEARTVVESSFSSLRGSLYRHADLGGGRLRYLHLVRDGRNFLASEMPITWDPEAPWPWLRTRPVILARWVVGNLSAVLLGFLDPSSYLRVRYEDLLLRPEETMARVGAFLGLDLSGIARNAGSGGVIPMRHIIAGNRLRLVPRLTLRPELSRTPPLSTATTVFFWTFGGWLALLLGYRPGSRTA